MASSQDEVEWLSEDQTQRLTRQEQIYVLNIMMGTGNYIIDFDSSLHRPPPASKVFVENLPQEEVMKQGETCSVCLKDYEVSTFKMILPCKHSFHSACILPWLRKTNSCPLCRYELPTDDVTYENYKTEQLRAKEREERIEELHNSMFT